MTQSCNNPMMPQEFVGLKTIQEECEWDKKKETMVSASLLLTPEERSDFTSKNGFMGVEIDGRRGLTQVTGQVPKRATVMRDSQTNKALGIPAVSGGEY